VTRGGRLERLFHLSQDLRLADHQRIQSRGHAKEMARRRHVGVGEQVRQKGVARELVVVAEERDDFLSRALGVGAGDVDLGPVARRQDDGFRGGRLRDQRLDGRAQVAAREVELLPEVDRRRPVTHAKEEQMHCPRSPRTYGSS
jgi:hypothetical protein